MNAWNWLLRLLRRAPGIAQEAQDAVGVGKELYEAAAAYRTGKTQDVLRGWVEPAVKNEAKRQLAEAVMRIGEDIDSWRTTPQG